MENDPLVEALLDAIIDLNAAGYMTPNALETADRLTTQILNTFAVPDTLEGM